VSDSEYLYFIADVLKLLVNILQQRHDFVEGLFEHGAHRAAMLLLALLK
jgi:hypothetical protein